MEGLTRKPLCTEVEGMLRTTQPEVLLLKPLWLMDIDTTTAHALFQLLNVLHIEAV